MNFESYRGKEVTIKSNNQKGTVQDVMHRKGTGGGLAVVFMVKDPAGKIHELAPYQLNLAV